MSDGDLGASGRLAGILVSSASDAAGPWARVVAVGFIAPATRSRSLAQAPRVRPRAAAGGLIASPSLAAGASPPGRNVATSRRSDGVGSTTHTGDAGCEVQRARSDRSKHGQTGCDGVVEPPARAEKLIELAEDRGLKREIARPLDSRPRLAHQRFGFVLAALSDTDERQRGPRRGLRANVVGPHRLHRFERKPLGLIEFPLFRQNVG